MPRARWPNAPAALPLLTFLLVSLLSLGGAPATAQTTWTVAPGERSAAPAKQALPTIGAALEAAAPGDTIRLQPGIHRWDAAKRASAGVIPAGVIPAGVVITGESVTGESVTGERATGDGQATVVTTRPLRFAPGPAATIQGVAFRPAQNYRGASLPPARPAAARCGSTGAPAPPSLA